MSIFDVFPKHTELKVFGSYQSLEFPSIKNIENFVLFLLEWLAIVVQASMNSIGFKVDKVKTGLGLTSYSIVKVMSHLDYLNYPCTSRLGLLKLLQLDLNL